QVGRDFGGLCWIRDCPTHGLSELAVCLPRRVALEDAGHPLDHLSERPETDALTVWQRAAPMPSHRLVGRRRRSLQLGNEARLADPRDAENRDELGRAFGGCPVEPLLQRGELAPATDEGGVVP